VSCPACQGVGGPEARHTCDKPARLLELAREVFRAPALEDVHVPWADRDSYNLSYVHTYAEHRDYVEHRSVNVELKRLHDRDAFDAREEDATDVMLDVLEGILRRRKERDGIKSRAADAFICERCKAAGVTRGPCH
jgi:hypothetical protein